MNGASGAAAAGGGVGQERSLWVYFTDVYYQGLQGASLSLVETCRMVGQQRPGERDLQGFPPRGRRPVDFVAAARRIIERVLISADGGMNVQAVPPPTGGAATNHNFMA